MSDPQSTSVTFPPAEKHCNGCGLTKPVGEFYRKGNGYAAPCKACRSVRDAQRRQNNLEKIRAYDRARSNRHKPTTEKRREYHRRWKERHPDHVSPTTGKQYGSKTPEAARAHAAVQRALRRGDLVKPTSCSKCGGSESRIEASHSDYSRPLDVVWLCARCHREEDARGHGKGGWTKEKQEKTPPPPRPTKPPEEIRARRAAWAREDRRKKKAAKEQAP